MSDKRIYVIGNRGSGVVLLRLNPLRVVVIEDAEIKKFSEETNSDGYAKLAAAFWRLTSDLRDNKVDKNTDPSVGIETIVSNGVKLTEVDFVYAVQRGSAHPDSEVGNVTGQMDNQMDAQMDSQMDSQMDNHMDSQMDTQMDSQMDTQMDSQAPTELPSWVTYYSPASDAIGRLFGKGGANIQNAVLSDSSPLKKD